ncbi:hypothetical protein SAMN02799630_05222 [Paenibacillus sp. UNCCL117]|uniref:hypothetical protein n=1 Tax=unclassified Paenibacillus TaxID=185978 RepID=UPI00088AA710|nr:MULTISPECIES: hypothetical protein [unclassified Paenibacillus]SDE34306.1 hypothetical protein SAMN04488602_12568 [Paenibacillus sp. cl123]SFW64240.1 hypothetical protein SAMN02799630_05222 [Paenibacillus sp. UNCCL117]
MGAMIKRLSLILITLLLFWVAAAPGFPYKQPEKMEGEYRQCGRENWDEYSEAGRRCLLRAYKHHEKAEFTSLKQGIETEPMPVTLRTTGTQDILYILDRSVDKLGAIEDQRLFIYTCKRMDTTHRMSVRPLVKTFFTLQHCTGENEPGPADVNGGI